MVACSFKDNSDGQLERWWILAKKEKRGCVLPLVLTLSSFKLMLTVEDAVIAMKKG